MMKKKKIIKTLRIEPDYKIIINKDFMYQKWSKENIIYIMNYKDIDLNLYNKVFQYIITLGTDERRRILINFNLLKDISKYDLSLFRICSVENPIFNLCCVNLFCV